jgi:hypothetical protein
LPESDFTIAFARLCSCGNFFAASTETFRFFLPGNASQSVLPALINFSFDWVSRYRGQ